MDTIHIRKVGEVSATFNYNSNSLASKTFEQHTDAVRYAKMKSTMYIWPTCICMAFENEHVIMVFCV